MIEIKDLLLKFDNLLFLETLKIDAIKNVLKKVIGIQVKDSDIKIKNNTVYLNIKPIYKNEIFINQDRITTLLEEELGKKAPKHIK